MDKSDNFRHQHFSTLLILFSGGSRVCGRGIQTFLLLFPFPASLFPLLLSICFLFIWLEHGIGSVISHNESS